MKAADIVARMLRLLGASGVDTPCAIPGDKQQQNDSGYKADNVTRLAPTRIHDMLHGDVTLEMFDWALWDHEMQELHGLVPETGRI
ncbi:hypothetical protein ABOM_003969 [Aspergillus bombycis]|uniref:Uncharacterized protein n=1 Tax=Aspergillus bombycis TaxID=109264 RepID=A0A1F8A638_9EURO|nr:hypothetical protein ABOM_003969 [Aspergillus bombycis]OGM47164.1 hypothetical protein ABOM_003969 [Aspergillus bombycis]